MWTLPFPFPLALALPEPAMFQSYDSNSSSKTIILPLVLLVRYSTNRGHRYRNKWCLMTRVSTRRRKLGYNEIGTNILIFETLYPMMMMMMMMMDSTECVRARHHHHLWPLLPLRIVTITETTVDPHATCHDYGQDIRIDDCRRISGISVGHSASIEAPIGGRIFTWSWLFDSGVTSIDKLSVSQLLLLAIWYVPVE